MKKEGKKLKVALVQMAAKPGRLEENLKLAIKLSKKAICKGASLVVLPELFDSGYCVEEAKFAAPVSNIALGKNPSLSALLPLCKESPHPVYIVGCTIEKSIEGRIYDTAFILGAEGLVGSYRKVYLWGGEVDRFSRGSAYPVFNLDFGGFKAKVGLQICYEIGFGEGARILALKGAKILIYPSAFGLARRYAWRLASRARALESGAYVLAANHSGSERGLDSKKLRFASDSRIIDPKGRVLASPKRYKKGGKRKSRAKNCLVMSSINLALVDSQRLAIPYLEDIDLALQSGHLHELQRR